MCLINVPLTEFSGFVLIKPEMHAHRDFAVLENIGEIEIGRSVVSWIAAEDDQQVNFAGADVGN